METENTLWLLLPYGSAELFDAKEERAYVERIIARGRKEIKYKREEKERKGKGKRERKSPLKVDTPAASSYKDCDPAGACFT